MKKKMNGKLMLNRETLRALDERAMNEAQGGGTTTTSMTSNPTLTCETCFATACRTQ